MIEFNYPGNEEYFNYCVIHHLTEPETPAVVKDDSDKIQLCNSIRSVICSAVNKKEYYIARKMLDVLVDLE